jgi:hypothetical protein
VQDRYGDYNDAPSAAVGAGAAALGSDRSGGCAVTGAPPSSNRPADPTDGGSGANGTGGGSTSSGGPDTGGGLLGQCHDVIAPRSRLRMRNVHRRRGVLSLHGRSSDRGCAATAALTARAGKVARVYVSVAKVRGRHGCRFLGHDGRLSKMRTCRRPMLFRMRGTTRWRVSLRAQLPPGIYRLVVRAYDGAGNKERPARGRNMLRISIGR